MAVDKLVDSNQLNSDLTSVANAIRTKGGTSASLAFPSGFVTAIGAIPSGGGITPTGTKTININSNGTTTEDVTIYANAQIVANVPNSYASSDNGKVVSNGALVSQSSRTVSAAGTFNTTMNNQVIVPAGTEGTPTATKGAVSGNSVTVTPRVTNSGGYISGTTKTGTAVTVTASELVSGAKSITTNGNGQDVANYATVNVNVPNSYGASDNGKVVSNGALVAQTAATYNANGTYNTTTINSVTVNVSGGGGGGGWTTDGIADLSEPSGNITINAGTIGISAFTRRSQITAVSAPTTTVIGQQAFDRCTGLRSIYAPLASVSSDSLSNCANLQTAVLGNANNAGNALRYCSSLQAVDFSSGSIGSGEFAHCSALSLVVLRSSSVQVLNNTSAFNGTPFASDGAGGTLVVPQGTISLYQLATNWSTILGYANNQIMALENSPFASLYVDGTPIT